MRLNGCGAYSGASAEARGRLPDRWPDPTLGVYLDRWLEAWLEARREAIKPWTYRGYRTQITHIKAVLGKVKPPLTATIPTPIARPRARDPFGARIRNIAARPHVYADMTMHQHPARPNQVEAARARALSGDEAARLASVLGLIADPVRARVLDALDAVTELCVGDLALALEVTEDSIGYALRILRTAGLVTSRKEGRMVFYRLAAGFPEPLFNHCLRLLSALPRTSEDDQ